MSLLCHVSFLSQGLGQPITLTAKLANGGLRAGELSLIVRWEAGGSGEGSTGEGSTGQAEPVKGMLLLRLSKAIIPWASESSGGGPTLGSSNAVSSLPCPLYLSLCDLSLSLTSRFPSIWQASARRRRLRT